MWTDPIFLLGVAVMTAAFSLGAVLVSWLHRIVERAETSRLHRLDTPYARFRVFLGRIQQVVMQRDDSCPIKKAEGRILRPDFRRAPIAIP